MELIQNAEDNEYKKGVELTLEFVLTKKDITGTGAPATLLVFNNEVGFSRKNIDSICSIGRSKKKGKRQQGFIGEKGIGFKSVFLVSSQPHIFSNRYRVRFTEEPNQDCGIGYVVPEWVSGKPHLSSICDVYGVNKIMPTTTFILPLKPDKVEAVRAQLSELHPEILLFLSKVKRLYVRGCDPEEADDVSTISIFSETEHMDLSDERANSRVVQLSVKEKKCDTELCKYYLWREAFPVKPGNQVSIRMDVEKWVITLAFPFGERLRRGMSSVGIFAFLPTAMVTNFPFVIQADFILASSRESILLDNVWNLGILDCVPSAFVNAFQSCVRELQLFPSVDQTFQFLPAQDSAIPVFNNLRESIKTSLRCLRIVPSEIFSGKSCLFITPEQAVRVLPKFRDLVLQMESEGAISSNLSSLNKVLHSSLDLEKYSAVLDFLDAAAASGHWYTKCIKSCNIVLLSDEVYVELLGFIVDNEKRFAKGIKTIPLIKYIKLGIVYNC
ncbi:PREDICTED: LOW QUALITY PROTEIN [Prunus dulcis]|uniref:PREDICTED: LOW QUALITY PROTEIN n=1 Tax=Prunus dulcis TaxID=3755 RepID=A0A5E4E7V0_PRUDU|nr:PREDICTED: LOW QUALITY PROTEIN [Prunus dulcis]